MGVLLQYPQDSACRLCRIDESFIMRLLLSYAVVFQIYYVVKIKMILLVNT